MEYKKGDKVRVIIPKQRADKLKFKNHVGTINTIEGNQISIIITDDKSLNITYNYFGVKQIDSGKWWYKDEIELYNVNKRLE